jgi:hypothetical protein
LNMDCILDLIKLGGTRAHKCQHIHLHFLACPPRHIRVSRTSRFRGYLGTVPFIISVAHTRAQTTTLKKKKYSS